ncbi:MAG TPA: hypothetical protein VLK82_15705 [Candidatus Tectomicrobia bacterium]|nr:hypothetical protein [Candidatus Tectomicrobia bacterium]
MDPGAAAEAGMTLLLVGICLLLAGMVGVLALCMLGHVRAARAWRSHEARRRRRWEAELAARRKTERESS